MITVKNQQAISLMMQAGQLLAHMFEELKGQVVPGASTLEIDTWIDAYLLKNGLISQSKGYHGYKHASCISLNDEVVHGIPAAHKKLRDGDLVKIDVCASLKGYCADMARCFFAGVGGSAEAQRLVQAAQLSLQEGIKNAVPGNHLSDISSAIQREVERHGFGVVRDFAGHGIGQRMHEEPEILNYGKPGKGPVIREGMAFALEPMITLGKHAVYVAEDGWTAKTVDKSLAAHVEDTVVVTAHGPNIITRLS